MQEFTVDTNGWDAFWEKWRDTVNAIPDMKEVLLERVGREVRDEVRRAIDASGLDDRRFGRVKQWQGPHMGSKLGYVAVRPESVMVQSGGENKALLNAGALTNYLTSEHRVRGPSGRAKRYRSRAEKARVGGFRFYKTAGNQAEKIAIQAAEEFLNSLEDAMSHYCRSLMEEAWASDVDLSLEAMASRRYTVYYNRAAFLLLSIPGVLDYTEFTLNGGKENLSVEADTVPVVGSVELTASGA